MNTRTVAFIRGSTALLLLIALLVALPVALITMVGWPLPTEVPAWEEVEWVLATGELDSGVLVKALALLVWVAWGQLAASAVAEVVAIARGRRASRTPGIRPLRLAAANLVTTAALLFGSLSRIADVAPVQPPDLQVAFADGALAMLAAGVDQRSVHAQGTDPTERTLVADPGTKDADERLGRAAEPAEPVWHVRPRDTLWGIAETTLDDGLRWREIHELNVGRRQADGGAVRPGDDLIRPGWVLRLPTDAAQARAAEAPPEDEPVQTTEPPTTSIVVEQGDTLWGLAGTHLEDPHRWPDLFEANQDRSQPDGRRLTDPDLIHPGWQLELPTQANIDATNPPPDDPEDDNGSTGETRSHQADLLPWAQLDPGAPPPPERTSPTAPDHRTADPNLNDIPVDQELDAESNITESDPPNASLDDSDAGAGQPLLLVGAGLAAAGVIATLERLRRTRRRRRPAGQRVHLPDGHLAQTEHRIRGLADAATAELLDVALRALAASCAREGRRTPEIALVSLSRTDVAVHLATSDADPPQGWQAEDDGRTWVLVRLDELQPLRELAAIALSPAPLLVTIGTQAASRRRVLLNLAHARCLAIDAGPEAVRTLLLGQALELATTTRADGLQVVIAGAGERLASLERIRCTTSAEAIDLLERRNANIDPDDPDDAATAALFLTPPPPASRDAVTRLSETARGQLAVVSPELPDTPWRLTINEHTVRLAPHALELEPLELTSHDVEAIEQLLVDAATPTYVDAEAPNPKPAVDMPTSTNGNKPAVRHQDDDGIQVRILGPVEVEGADEFASAKAEELVAYLAMHRNGADTDTLQEALWPGTTPSAGRLHTTVYRARQALGEHATGEAYVPRPKQGRYRVSPGVGLDYEQFESHVTRAESNPQDAIRELRAALELVRGQPLSCTSGEYAWATYEVHVIEQRVSDIAHQLAQLCLEQGEPDAARWAAERGLLADPYSEILYRDLMQIAAHSGNTSEVHAIVQRLRHLIADETGANDADDHLDPMTVQLFEELTKRSAPR